MQRSNQWTRPRTFSEFKEKYPTLLRKLSYWASRRRVSSLNSKEDSEEEVNTYIQELVLSRSDDFASAKPYLEIWGKVLSTREKQELSRVVPYAFNEDKLFGTGVIKQQWYDSSYSSYSVLTEEVIDELHYKRDFQGVLTVNSYGAIILNADRMLIVDVDIAGEADESANAQVSKRQALTALKVWQEENGGDFRVYKTAGGLRYIETSKEWQPSSLKTKALMTNLYADPKYSLLCNTQETFRARLTPKPWRYKDYDTYIQDEEEAENVAVCELIDIVGEKKIDDSFKDLIRLHDKKTKALSKDLMLV